MLEDEPEEEEPDDHEELLPSEGFGSNFVTFFGFDFLLELLVDPPLLALDFRTCFIFFSGVAFEAEFCYELRYSALEFK